MYGLGVRVLAICVYMCIYSIHNYGYKQGVGCGV